MVFDSNYQIGINTFNHLKNNCKICFVLMSALFSPLFASSEKINQNTAPAVNALQMRCIEIVNPNNPTLKDTVCIPLEDGTIFYEASTQDINGNGYLDHLRLSFDKELSLAILKTAKISVVQKNENGSTIYAFDVINDSICALDTSFKNFRITLREPTDLEFLKTTTNGQTGWTPEICIHDCDNVITRSIHCVDKAGPVVWLVQNKIDINVPDHSNDEISVFFSEPLKDILGNSISEKPHSIFVLYYEENNVRRVDDLALLGNSEGAMAPSFITSATSKLASVFKTTSGKFINHRYLIKFSTRESCLASLYDVFNNPVSANNLPVSVTVVGATTKIASAPNPMSPNFSVPNNPGMQAARNNELLYADPEIVVKKARETGISGTVIDLQMPQLTQEMYLRLTGELSIYDIAGNLVHRRSNQDNLAPSKWLTSKNQIEQFAVNWNGLNDQGIRVAPGVYRLVFKMSMFYKDIFDPTQIKNLPIEAVSLQGVTR